MSSPSAPEMSAPCRQAGPSGRGLSPVLPAKRGREWVSPHDHFGDAQRPNVVRNLSFFLYLLHPPSAERFPPFPELMLIEGSSVPPSPELRCFHPASVPN